MDAELAERMNNDATGKYGHPAYYDREGNRISLARMCELGRDLDYKILRTTVVPTGRVISSWLGEDHRATPDGEAPSIYGTILQRVGKENFDHSVETFATSAEECLEHHVQLVARMS
jgi:hypothetical protein